MALLMYWRQWAFGFHKASEWVSNFYANWIFDSNKRQSGIQPILSLTWQIYVGQNNVCFKYNLLNVIHIHFKCSRGGNDSGLSVRNGKNHIYRNINCSSEWLNFQKLFSFLVDNSFFHSPRYNRPIQNIILLLTRSNFLLQVCYFSLKEIICYKWSNFPSIIRF